MIIFEKFERQNRIKIHTKMHQIAPFRKIFSGGSIHPNTPNKTRMSLHDMQSSKSEKKFLPFPPKSWLVNGYAPEWGICLSARRGEDKRRRLHPIGVLRGGAR